MPSGTWRTISTEPPELGRRDGLAYALFAPAEQQATGGVVIVHGADSSKESHYDFARKLRAVGVAAVCFDVRGHGESEGALGAGALADVATIASLLPEGPIGLRGSSMGGWLALAAAERVGAQAVVAICPATSRGLLRGLEERRFAFAADPDGLALVLAGVDLEVAAHDLGERLLLLHAEGDETVPVEHSRRLHAAAPGSRYVEAPGGHHRSIQHDDEYQALSVRFLQRRLQTSTS
ncbi:MAG TPA: alpha/beta fold hydrolase [Solirubrobacteraceae bacterium]|nr:alpha/beta fold hydrolase [Solirubrobacteraceae bacterium]